MKKYFSRLILILVFLTAPFLSNAEETEEKSPAQQEIEALFASATEHKNNPTLAIEYYFSALKKAREHDLKPLIAKSLHTIGNNYFFLAQLDNAESYWSQALETYQAAEDRRGASTVLGNLGIIKERSGEIDEAAKLYKEALGISREIGNDAGVSTNLSNLGSIYLSKGEFPTALEYYQTALKMFEEADNKPSIANALSNIGIVYREQDDIEQALKTYERALSIFEEINNERGISFVLTNLGNIYNGAKKDYDKALEYFLRSIELAEKTGNKRVLAANLGNIGIIYEYQENYSDALEYYKRSLAILEENGDARGVAISYINIASALTGLKKLDSAFSSAQLALEKCITLGDLNLQLRTYEHLSDISFEQGNYQAALEYKDEWIKLNEEVFNNEKSKTIAELQTQYETEKKDQEIDSLNKDNEIQKLRLEESAQRSKAERLLFILFAVIFVVVVAVIWYLFRDFKRQQKLKEQQLEYQKVITEQRMLRSQMNPHFIYNSLNSIQSFISSQQPEEAEVYLAKFAKLIRGILENSRVDFVSLEKELEVLELYLALEQLRFEKLFDYEFHIDDEVEEEFISLPPMLVQPFVENAILHGFKGRSDGKIDIRVTEEDDYIIYEIEDNGIGRTAANENQVNQKKHQSLATTITEERLDALTYELKRPASFEIVDKLDPDSKSPLGTRVVFKIPVKDK